MLGMNERELDLRAKQMAKTDAELGETLRLGPLETWGIVLSLTERLAIASVQQGLAQAHADVARANGALRAVATSKVVPSQRCVLENAIEELARIGRFIHAQKPVAVCAVCKRLPDVQQECASCIGTGYLTKKQVAELDPILKNTKEMVVRYRGEIVPITRLERP